MFKTIFKRLSKSFFKNLSDDEPANYQSYRKRSPWKIKAAYKYDDWKYR